MMVVTGDNLPQVHQDLFGTSTTVLLWGRRSCDGEGLGDGGGLKDCLFRRTDAEPGDVYPLYGFKADEDSERIGWGRSLR